MAEKMLRVEPEVVEGSQEIDGERAVGREVGGGGFTIGPEAVIEDLRHDAAVGVVPTGDARCIAGVDCVLEDGLMLAEGCPLAGCRVLERDEKASSGDVDCVGGNACKEGGKDIPGVYASGNNLREDRGLSGEFVERGKVKAGKAALVELLVGEFVEQNPDDARVRLRGVRGDLSFVQYRSWIEIPSLPATPDKLPKDKQAREGEDTEEDSS